MRLHLKAGLEAPPSHFFASGGTGQTLGGSKGTGINPEADNRNSEETEALSEPGIARTTKASGSVGGSGAIKPKSGMFLEDLPAQWHTIG